MAFMARVEGQRLDTNADSLIVCMCVYARRRACQLYAHMKHMGVMVLAGSPRAAMDIAVKPHPIFPSLLQSQAFSESLLGRGLRVIMLTLLLEHLLGWASLKDIQMESEGPPCCYQPALTLAIVILLSLLC